MNYRPDIDGLRAIAVIAVILYHFKVPGFSGGYVGVDVFFVISGFLITGIIRHDLQAGKFSIGRFYERRARRILPALMLVVLCTMVAGWFLLLPDELQSLGKSTAAVALFGSNFYFWKLAGYFSPAAHELPLLHTWSLAVEEQFYLVWPLAMMAAFRGASRKVMPTIVASVFIVSLAAGEWLLQRGSVAAGFYLAPFRAWELMLGAGLALWPTLRIPTKLGNELLAAVGLALIVAPVAAFDDQTVFPGFSALAPCFGAGLLIMTGDGVGSISSRWLSARPLVFLGLISYSLYLWHWPMVSFFNYTEFRSPNAMEATAMLAACLILSVLSWRYVEVPFRTRSAANRASSRLVLRRAAFATILIFLLGLSLTLTRGVPERVGEPTRAVLNAHETLHPFARDCLAYVTATAPVPGCTFGAHSLDGEYRVVLWGDSHAAHWMPAIEALGRQQGWAARQMSMAGRGPFLTAVWNRPRYRNCLPFNQAVMAEIAANPNIELVLLAAHWGPYEQTFEEIAETVRQLTDEGKRIVFLGQVPEADFPPYRCLALAKWRGEGADLCAIRKDSPLYQRIERQNAFVKGLAETFASLQLFLPPAVLCDERTCRTEDGDSSLYFDMNHITPPGARLLSKHMDIKLASHRAGHSGSKVVSPVKSVRIPKGVGMEHQNRLAKGRAVEVIDEKL